MSTDLPANSEAPRSDTSPTIGKLALALAKAQAVIQPAKKNRDNPFFKSKYAGLSDVWESVRKPLADNELAVIQTSELDSEGLSLVTILAHSSGEWVRAKYPIRPTKHDPQGMGSALTYARRYALAAISGATADDDDDGEVASQMVNRNFPPAKPAKAAKEKAPPAPGPEPEFQKPPEPSKADKIAAAFSGFQVSKPMLEAKFKKTLEDLSPEEVDYLHDVYADLKSGVALSEHFDLLPGEKD